MMKALNLIARINWLVQTMLDRMREVGPWMDSYDYAETHEFAVSEDIPELVFNSFMGATRGSLSAKWMRERFAGLNYEVVNMALIPWCLTLGSDSTWCLKVRSYDKVNDDRHNWTVSTILGESLDSLKDILLSVCANIHPVNWTFDGCGEEPRTIPIYSFRYLSNKRGREAMNGARWMSWQAGRLDLRVTHFHYSTSGVFGAPHMPVCDVHSPFLSYPDSSFPDFWVNASVIGCAVTERHWYRYSEQGGDVDGQEE